MKIVEITEPVERLFTLTLNEDELVTLRSYAAVLAGRGSRFISLTNSMTSKPKWSFNPEKCFK